ncbi:MAG TPA: HAMP domain-containing sensor histidine kinase [Dermatophilaceae bacterium]|nr:HAMP domain-containing sensor histidine kinase [Dermatophilaceae bacterium]
MSWDLRPLDPVRSIKAKLGLLVGASIAVTSLLTYLSIYYLQWPARWAVTGAVVVGLLVSQLLARGMTSPLRQMTAAAREMAAGRAPGVVRTTSRDEVGELAVAFTTMAEQLAAADAQRRELLANVAHELRTPVAALRAQAENLVDGVQPADSAALGELLGQVERLGVLVDDLLGLARAEAGVVPLEREPTRVRRLVEDVAAEARTVRTDRVVEVDIDPSLVAHVDPQRLRQIIANLVDNATRHTPPGGVVRVAGGVEPDGSLVLDVADEGPGIPEAARTAVFERFRHGAVTGPLPRIVDGPGGASPTGGTGLGLAIARWAATLHGGTLEVVPPEGPPGAATTHHGARLRLSLPPA